MLTFFRKTRKTLLGSEQTPKYILYAIGEIALVVIGILIALQVNNWNEARKTKIVQREFLVNLVEEFKINTAVLKSKNIDHKLVFEKNKQLAELMSPHAEPIDTYAFDTLMFALAFIPQYKPVNAFSGNPDLVNDNQLKVMMANWSTELAAYSTAAQIIYDLYYNVLYPTISSLYQMKNVPKGLNVMHHTKRSEFMYDQKDVLSNAALENHVIMRSYNAGAIYERGKKLELVQIEIIERIDSLLFIGDTSSPNK